MNAVIIYEGRESARKANALLQSASDRPEAATQWSVKPWRADLLNWPPLAKEALREAAGAHLMVLALGGKADFPAGLLNWLEVWASRRQVQDAALAVFGGSSSDILSATTTPALSQFAERHGLSLILRDVCLAQGESTELREDLPEREAAQTSTMAPMLEQASSTTYQHWGVNE